MKERKSYLHNIHFYKDSKGREPVLDYLKKLAQKGDKDSRIKLNKINDYIQILSEYGTQAGEPYIKHLTGDIWELRPIKDRILFVRWINGSYVLLHQFMKKTQKTPTKELVLLNLNTRTYSTRYPHQNCACESSRRIHYAVDSQTHF